MYKDCVSLIVYSLFIRLKLVCVIVLSTGEILSQGAHDEGIPIPTAWMRLRRS